MEELLADGLHRAGASPAHLAIRGTPAAASVRCAWRGIARTATQREDAIRFWFKLGAADAIPDLATLELLFTVTLDTLDPDYRETAKANFLAIARGGESMAYLFLTCFADYAVTAFLLGTGTTPATVTVAYDRRGEAASYDLYVREHAAGTYGDAALQTRGAYEAGLQAQVVAAEAALSEAIGGREAVVFLAPMGAHNAIGFEAWQAVAQWAVVTDDAGGGAGGAGRHAGGRPGAHAAAGESDQPDHDGGGQRRPVGHPGHRRGPTAAGIPGPGGLRRHHAGGRADDDVYAAATAGGADLHQRHGDPQPGREPRAGQGLRDAAGGGAHAAGDDRAELEPGRGAQRLARGDDGRHADAGDGADPGHPGPERHAPGRAGAAVRADDPEPQRQQPDRRHPHGAGLAGPPDGVAPVRQQPDGLRAPEPARRDDQRPSVAQPALLRAAAAQQPAGGDADGE